MKTKKIKIRFVGEKDSEFVEIGEKDNIISLNASIEINHNNLKTLNKVLKMVNLIKEEEDKEIEELINNDSFQVETFKTILEENKELQNKIKEQKEENILVINGKEEKFNNATVESNYNPPPNKFGFLANSNEIVGG